MPASMAAAAGPGPECADAAASGGPTACATAGSGGPEGAPAAQSGAAPRALNTENRSGLLLLVPLMLGLHGKVSLLLRTRAPEEREGVLSDIDDVTLCPPGLPQRTRQNEGVMCGHWAVCQPRSHSLPFSSVQLNEREQRRQEVLGAAAREQWRALLCCLHIWVPVIHLPGGVCWAQHNLWYCGQLRALLRWLHRLAACVCPKNASAIVRGCRAQLNPRYCEQLRALLRWPQSCGVLGGRPSSSLLFVGAQAGHVLFLDPHEVQEVCAQP